MQQSLANLGTETLPKLLVFSFIISFVPLPENYYLGNRGEPMFAPLAPFLLLLATGIVCLSWWVLQVLMWPIRKFGPSAFGRCVMHLSDCSHSFIELDVQA
jgi:GPI inositol-deacylase